MSRSSATLHLCLRPRIPSKKKSMHRWIKWQYKKSMNRKSRLRNSLRALQVQKMRSRWPKSTKKLRKKQRTRHSHLTRYHQLGWVSLKRRAEYSRKLRRLLCSRPIRTKHMIVSLQLSTKSDERWSFSDVRISLLTPKTIKFKFVSRGFGVLGFWGYVNIVLNMHFEGALP